MASGGSKPLRDSLYSSAMQTLAAAYPADVEAQAFYALSLLGLSQGERVIPTYMRAGAISLALLQQHPDHPGAAHYTIHSFDDPDHASSDCLQRGPTRRSRPPRRTPST